MAKLETDEKKLFVVASPDPQRALFFSKIIQEHISNCMVFIAHDGFEAMFKMENTPPHVLMIDTGLEKFTPVELTQKILNHSKLNETSVIIISPIPDDQHFVDHVVTCQVQFLTNPHDAKMVSSCLMKSLNRLADDRNFSYRLRFLSPGEILFREKDEANSVFIVRRGEMRAFKGRGEDTRILGSITTGEFVGEMAHINSEPRSATVEALSDCELIEIPMGTLDTVLFTKPAWSKALVATLSKRLKRTNESL
jgi:CRP-like cAMP-binding protein